MELCQDLFGSARRRLSPLTILIDTPDDGVHLSYDRTASYLASYGNAPSLEVARNLDAKIEALLTRAAA
jgi:hypothetical protein